MTKEKTLPFKVQLPRTLLDREIGVIKGDTPRTEHESKTIDRFDDIYMKKFCSTKDRVKKEKKQAIEQEKILATHSYTQQRTFIQNRLKNSHKLRKK